MIYCIVLFLIIAITLLSENKKIENNYLNYLSYLIIIIITLFAALRYECWTDWDMYYNYFTNMSSMNKDFEIGFVLWNKLIGQLTSNYNIYLLISYFILLYLLKESYKFADEKLYNYSFITLFAIFILPSSGFRQFIAMTITLYSIKFIIENKLDKFLICLALACLFHRSAIIFIIAYFMKDKKVDLKELIILVLVGILFLELDIFKRVIEIIMNLLSFLPSIAYRVKLYYSSIDNSKSIFSFGFIRKTLLIIYLLYIRTKLTNVKNDKLISLKFNTYFNIYLIGYILSLFISGTFSRIESYFYIVECILFPLSLRVIDNLKLRNIILGIFIVLYFTMFCSKLNTFYPELYIPYKSCLY